MLLAALFRLQPLQLFRTAELRWIMSKVRLIAFDREVPCCAYDFEVAEKATL
jgi:hypothetical protein